MGTKNKRNGMDLTEAEDIKMWQEYTELYKKDLQDPDNHDSYLEITISRLSPGYLESQTSSTVK